MFCILKIAVQKYNVEIHSPGHCPEVPQVETEIVSRSAVKSKRFLFIFQPAMDLRANFSNVAVIELLLVS